MKKHFLSILFFFSLVLSPFALADYSNYIGQGDSQTISDYKIGGTFTNNLSEVAMLPSTGFPSEPISYDFNRDGLAELIYFGGDNTTYMTRSPDPTYVLSAIGLGKPRAQPVVCDMNIDNIKEYVGIFRSGTQDVLYVLEVEGDSFVVKYSENVSDVSNTTDIYYDAAFTPIRCSPFYGNQFTGSNYAALKQYAIWLDREKKIHFFTTYGGVTNHTIHDVNADYYDAHSLHSFDYYSNDIIVDNTFDKQGEVTLQFIAGDMFIVMDEENNVYEKNISSSLQSGGTIRLQGGYRNGLGGGTGTVWYSNGPTPIAGQAYGITEYSFYCLSGCDGIGLLPKISLSSGSTSMATAINKYTVGSKDNIFSITLEITGNPHMKLMIIDSGTMLMNRSAADLFSMGTVQFPYRINAFNIRENIYVPSYTYLLEVDPSNFSLAQRIFNFSGGSSAVPINLDEDGYLDWISVYPGMPRAYLSGIFTETPTQDTYPFSVSPNSTYNDSGQFFASMKVTTDFNHTYGEYNYALTCNIAEFTLWNELFKIGYNFTENDVSFNVNPPEQFLSYQGMTFPINSTYAQFDLFKTGNGSYNDNLRQRINIIRSGNNTFDYIAHDKDSMITYWLRFSKNGTAGRLYRVFFGDEVVNIGNYTVGFSEDINIEYTPAYDFGNNINYFTTTIRDGSTVIATDSTYTYDGQDITSVELYSDTLDTTIRLMQLGLFKVSELQPTFTQFQNGQIINDSGFTITTPPPTKYISGDGYDIVADYNNVFYSVCAYPNPGVYTQRHYIAPLNIVDYSNYKDLTINVTEEVAPEGSLEANANISPISRFFFGFIKDPITALVVGLLLSVALGIFGAFIMGRLSPHAGGFLLIMIGGICFVVGLIATWAIGLTPLWVILLLVIVAAALVALVFRSAVSGG